MPESADTSRYKEIFQHWPPQLPSDELQQLLTHAIDWSLAHGLLMLPAPSQTEQNSISSSVKEHALAQHAPFALFPSPYPAQALEQARKLQPLFNRLVYAVSQDWGFMDSIFERYAES
jgi:glutathione synthase